MNNLSLVALVNDRVAIFPSMVPDVQSLDEINKIQATSLSRNHSLQKPISVEDHEIVREMLTARVAIPGPDYTKICVVEKTAREPSPPEYGFICFY